VERAPLYDRVFEVERYRVRYAGYLDLLARYWFTEDNIGALASEYSTMIVPFVTQSTGDKAFYGDRPMFPADAFGDSAAHYREFARQRSEYILTTLAQEGWQAAP
jgi:hypothetical protein